jgi:hypothetical protein
MAHPNIASLNSLAQVLRQAHSLYRECRSILNYFDEKEASGSIPASGVEEAASKWIAANRDADSTPLAVFEPRKRYGKRII